MASFLHAQACCATCCSFGPNGVNSSSVTWGRRALCTCTCLAVYMKYANDISKEVLWEHFTSRFSKYAWLPEVLTLWFFPFLRRYFFSCWSAESLWKMRPEWIKCFLSTFWLHFSRSQVSGTCKWKTCWGSTWLISNFCLVPLTHWPLNYLQSCLGCVAAAKRQAEVNSIWLTCSVFSHSMSHVTSPATLTKYRGVTW